MFKFWNKICSCVKKDWAGSSGNVSQCKQPEIKMWELCGHQIIKPHLEPPGRSTFTLRVTWSYSVDVSSAGSAKNSLNMFLLVLDLLYWYRGNTAGHRRNRNPSIKSTETKPQLCDSTRCPCQLSSLGFSSNICKKWIIAVPSSHGDCVDHMKEDMNDFVKRAIQIVVVCVREILITIVPLTTTNRMHCCCHWGLEDHPVRCIGIQASIKV